MRKFFGPVMIGYFIGYLHSAFKAENSVQYWAVIAIVGVSMGLIEGWFRVRS